MTEICLINTALVKALCIQDYVIYGIILFIVGLLIAIFVPIDLGKKIGLGMVILGIIMTIFFPLIRGWWEGSVGFQIMVYSLVTFIIIMMVLFPNSPVGINKRRK